MMRCRATTLLLLFVLTGCASTRVVRLDTGQGPPLEYTPPSAGRSIEVGSDDFEESLALLVLNVPLSLRPPQARWLVRASAHGATMDRVLQGSLRKHYGRWCHAHEAPGDCLSLLEDGLGFSPEDKLAMALGLSLDPMHESIADAVEDTLNPTFFKAVVVSALVSWAVLAANPEPIFTKAAATVAAVLLAYLGVDAFLTVVTACRELKAATDRATTFQELEAAGTRFGRVVGKEVARVFVLAVALVVGKGTTSLATRLAMLPGYAEAMVLSASHLGLNLAAVESVSAVAVVDGGIVLTLAPGAVAMAASGPRDGKPETHHLGTIRNSISTARGGPWTPKFQKLFDRAGMSMNDPSNKADVLGHKGPHPEAYHVEVYQRMERAMRGCRDVQHCQRALKAILKQLADEVATKGTFLNKLITHGASP